MSATPAGSARLIICISPANSIALPTTKASLVAARRDEMRPKPGRPDTQRRRVSGRSSLLAAPAVRHGLTREHGTPPPWPSLLVAPTAWWAYRRALEGSLRRLVSQLAEKGLEVEGVAEGDALCGDPEFADSGLVG
jgi:hypothetical protein